MANNISDKDKVYLTDDDHLNLTKLPESPKKSRWAVVADRALANERGLLKNMTRHGIEKDMDIHYPARLLDTKKAEDEAILAQDRVFIQNGLFVKKGKDDAFVSVSTTEMTSHHKIDFAAFVLTNDQKMFVFNHRSSEEDNPIYHSSYSNQNKVINAGELIIVDGALKTINDHSGHYQPNRNNMFQMLKLLEKMGVDFSKTEVLFHGSEPVNAMEFYNLMKIQSNVDERKEAAVQRERRSNDALLSVQASPVMTSNSAGPMPAANMEIISHALIEPLELKIQNLKIALDHIEQGFQKYLDNNPKGKRYDDAKEILRNIETIKENIVGIKGDLKNINSTDDINRLNTEIDLMKENITNKLDETKKGLSGHYFTGSFTKTINAAQDEVRALQTDQHRENTTPIKRR